MTTTLTTSYRNSFQREYPSPRISKPSTTLHSPSSSPSPNLTSSILSTSSSSSSTSAAASEASSSDTSLDMSGALAIPLLKDTHNPNRYSSSTSSTPTSKPKHQARPRIRFAPLPDPRRSVIITDEGVEIPMDDDTHFPAGVSLRVLKLGVEPAYPTGETSRSELTDNALSASTSTSASGSASVSSSGSGTSTPSSASTHTHSTLNGHLAPPTSGSQGAMMLPSTLAGMNDAGKNKKRLNLLKGFNSKKGDVQIHSPYPNASTNTSAASLPNTAPSASGSAGSSGVALDGGVAAANGAADATPTMATAVESLTPIAPSYPDQAATSSSIPANDATPTSQPQSRDPAVSVSSSAPTTAQQKRKTKSKSSMSKSKRKSLTTEEILTLGAIRLFRSNKDQDEDRPIEDTEDFEDEKADGGGWGLGLSRWTSAGSLGGPKRERQGVELMRTQSTQSYQNSKKGKKKRGLGGMAFWAGSSSSDVDEKSEGGEDKAKGGAGSRHTAIQQQPRHKGARMLNGRIYGQKRNAHAVNPNHNPFANARDDDDAFVEWGYGGMGSVKGARSAGVDGGGRKGSVNWERLSGGSVVTGSAGAKTSATASPSGPGDAGFVSYGRGGAGRMKARPSSAGSGSGGDTNVAGEDDGSGMAWLKRRREERERKAREAKEKEKEEREAESAMTTLVGDAEEEVKAPKVVLPEDEGKGEKAEERDEPEREGGLTPNASMLNAAAHAHAHATKHSQSGHLHAPTPSRHLQPPSHLHPRTPSPAHTVVPGPSPTSDPSSSTSVPTFLATASPLQTPTPKKEEKEHVLQAVAIPAHLRNRSYLHRRTSSRSTVRGAAIAATAQASTPADEGAGAPSQEEGVDASSDKDKRRHEPIVRLRSGSESSFASTSTSSSGSDDDSGSGEGGSEEAEEDADARAEEKRQTALSAGMEKISRHKE